LPCLALHLALPSCLLTINPKTLFFFPEFPPNPEKKHVLGFIGCHYAEIFSALF